MLNLRQRKNESMHGYQMSLPFGNLPRVSNGKERLYLQIPGTIWNDWFCRPVGSHGPFVCKNAPVSVYRTESNGVALLYSTVEVDELGNLIREIPGWRKGD